ncbi:MAG: (4Fe-4S)-binding protein [Candidatus Omnitrophica bacterium]|nr:(4Fe-4S)-binding protein [Candidatus Omnitrophota bacterium]
MRQVVVISGKGGTGKTIVTASFAALAKNKIMADCDVDAADLHLMLAPQVRQRHDFFSGVTARVDPSRCVQCGRCREVCRFDAIGDDFTVDPVACEGCAFCSYVCTERAVEMKRNLCGQWFVSDTRCGPLVHAKLGVAEENSGKLVSTVREKAREMGMKQKREWVIIDGSPGIGCPVIASLSGVDCAVVVTEPSLSGLHDARRVIEVAVHFGVPVRLVINKWDLNPDLTRRIEAYASQTDIPVLGKIRFDPAVVQAMVNGRSIVETAQSETSETIRHLWDALRADLSDFPSS